MASTALSTVTASSAGVGGMGESSLSTVTSRPARKQVTHREVENLRQTHDRANQAGLSYNIWYNKWAGGDNDDGRSSSTKATTRVRIARDAGYTRANAQGGAFVCLFFARGYCPNGSDCTFLHALPIDTPDQGHDVFGRDKHGNFRDDMGGVGSIQRVNRTLYVGRIVEEADSTQRMSMGGTQTKGKDRDGAGNDFGNGGKGWDLTMERNRMSDTEKVLHRHFGEFGELERIRVLHTRGCGFVTFVREVDAQFAKEAMMHQSLDHDECINLRWATDDPNPIAQKRNRDEREKQGMEAIKTSIPEGALEAGRSLLELEEGAEEAEGRDEKRLRIEPADGDDGITDEEYARLVAENEQNWAEMDRIDAELQEKAWAEAGLDDVDQDSDDQAAEEEEAKANGSLIKSSQLKQLALLRQHSGTATAASGKTALGGLADYGSDSEEE